MARGKSTFTFTFDDPMVANNLMQQFLVQNKFKAINYKGTTVYQLGNGLITAKKFIEYTIQGNTLTIYAYVFKVNKPVILDDAYYCSIPKTELKNILYPFLSYLEQYTQGTAQNNIPNNIQNNMSNNMQTNMQNNMPNNMQANMQNNMPNNMQTNMQNNMPNNMQTNMQNNMPNNMQTNMQNNMPNNMQGNMYNNQNIQNYKPNNKSYNIFAILGFILSLCGLLSTFGGRSLGIAYIFLGLMIYYGLKSDYKGLTIATIVITVIQILLFGLFFLVGLASMIQ